MPSKIQLHSGKTVEVTLDPPQLQSKLHEPEPYVQLETVGKGSIFIRPDSVEGFHGSEDKSPIFI